MALLYKFYLKILFLIAIALLFCSCLFGANEWGGEIIHDVHLAGWDDDVWISYSPDDGVWDSDSVIIERNVFAVGNTKNFIIAKQHPCKAAFFDSCDSLIDKTITNYFIIDTREKGYRIYKYDTQLDFDEGKERFRIPKDLPFKYYAKEQE